MPESMAVRWSSENVVAEYRDLLANAMAVDYNGQLAVLAGRKQLAIIDLNQPMVCLKKHSRQSKWEVGTAEWSPTHEKRNMFAITCNQRAELLVCHESDVVTQHVLRAHTRVISDLNWAPHDSNLIATCSVDAYVYLWDVRDPRRPSQALCAVAGASQVKWNKARTGLLATSHDGDVRLWDYRKGTSPVQYIAAHLSKIHGIDWSPIQGQEFQLATSSQDCTVKFWDVTNPCQALNILSSNSPVWRARYTPFGEGLITVVVPQLRRGENSLLLWNISNLRSHVHTFVGHNDVVLEFHWREHCEDYQLVTWSKDQSLRIWHIDSQLQKLCGHDTDNDELEHIPGPVIETLEINNANGPMQNVNLEPPDSNTHAELLENSSAPSHLEDEDEKINLTYESEVTEDDEARDVSKNGTFSPQQPKNLQQEFHLLNRNIPNVRVEELDFTARTCIVSASSGKSKVRLLLTFPVSYPYNSPPSIQFCKGSSVSNNVKSELTKALKTICQQHVKKNLSCLEPCLRQLISTMENCSVAEKESTDVNGPYSFDTPQPFLPPKIYGSYHDSNIPFPRTSGATFSGAGYLVCFTRPAHMKYLPNAPDVTPRSLSALLAYAANPMQGHPSQTAPAFNLMYPPVAQSPTGDPNVSISAFYYQDRRQRARGKLRKDDPQCQRHTVCSLALYDISKLLPISKELAQAYILDDYGFPADTCLKHMSAAASVGRKDLVQLWSLAAISANSILMSPPDPNCGIPWSCHPFGRKMLHSLIHHYIQLGDVQTVAMLCCTFSSRSSAQQPSKKISSIKDVAAYHPGGSPYHTIHPGDTLESYPLGALLKSNRSNSWSDCLDDFDNRNFSSLTQIPKDIEREQYKNNSKLLDPKLTFQYDEFKRAYAEILYQWNLLEARAQVLKYFSVTAQLYKGIKFSTICHHCGKDPSSGPQCTTCKKYTLQCCICRIAVKGACNFCMACGHGGHTYHLMEWFKSESTCPAGCGCNCLVENHPLDS